MVFLFEYLGGMVQVAFDLLLLAVRTYSAAWCLLYLALSPLSAFLCTGVLPVKSESHGALGLAGEWIHLQS